MGRRVPRIPPQSHTPIHEKSQFFLLGIQNPVLFSFGDFIFPLKRHQSNFKKRAVFPFEDTNVTLLCNRIIRGKLRNIIENGLPLCIKFQKDGGGRKL